MNEIDDFYVTLCSDNLNKNYFIDQEKLSGQIGENAFRVIYDSVFETVADYIVDGLNEAGYDVSSNKNLTAKDLENNPNMISINADHYSRYHGYVDKDIPNTGMKITFIIEDKNREGFSRYKSINDINYALKDNLDLKDNEMISLIIDIHGKMIKTDTDNHKSIAKNIKNIMCDAMNLAKKQDELLGDLCTEDFYAYRH